MKAEIPPYTPPTAGDYAQHILSRITDQQPGNKEKLKKFGSLKSRQKKCTSR